jgi:hypothetical protein
MLDEYEIAESLIKTGLVLISRLIVTDRTCGCGSVDRDLRQLAGVAPGSMIWRMHAEPAPLKQQTFLHCELSVLLPLLLDFWETRLSQAN